MAKSLTMQQYGLLTLIVIGLICMLIALIYLLIALASYKRRGKFCSAILIGVLCLGLAAMLMDENGPRTNRGFHL